MTRILAAAALAFLLGGAVPARAEPVVYVAGDRNEFGTLSLTSGAFTPIGTLALPPGDLMFGMGFGPDGNLYGLDKQLPDAHLYRIDTTNAHLTDLGAIGLSNVDATADANGKLYALSRDFNSTYYTMIPPSPATNVVGPTGIQIGRAHV